MEDSYNEIINETIVILMTILLGAMAFPFFIASWLYHGIEETFSRFRSLVNFIMTEK